MSESDVSAGIVIDCSVSLAWFIEDERSDFADRMLDLITEKDVRAPAL